jgi:hypothetical protein
MFNASTVPELIAAIDAANLNAEPDSIALAAAATFGLTEANNSFAGLPGITATEGLTIFGNGSIIERSSSAPSFRLFYVAPGASLALENLTLQWGRVGSTVEAQNYPGTVAGGAISNSGNLALVGVTVQDSSVQGYRGRFCPAFCASGDGWPALGGGVYSNGVLTIENSSLNNNQALGGRGGDGGRGGPGRGGNGRGGGLYVGGGSATLSTTLVTGNVARGGQGGSWGSRPPGPAGQAIGGGIYIAASAAVDLDEFTLAHVTGNTASTSHPDIFGSYQVIPNQNLFPGDFNLDGAVDAADYVVWRKTDGTQAGYNLWRTHFGETSGSGAAGYPLGASAGPLPESVPEPGTIVLAAIAATAWAVVCKYRYEVPRHPSVDIDAAVLISSKVVIHV